LGYREPVRGESLVRGKRRQDSTPPPQRAKTAMYAKHFLCSSTMLCNPRYFLFNGYNNKVM
jgi:hypothetical protein